MSHCAKPTPTVQQHVEIQRPERVIDAGITCARTGLSLDTIVECVLTGDFPAPRVLARKGRGVTLVGWLERDIDNWIVGLPAAVPSAVAEWLPNKGGRK